eukprot:6555138-Prorocentrum_lima.AAC.1
MSTRWAVILPGAGTNNATSPPGLPLLSFSASAVAVLAGLWAMVALGTGRPRCRPVPLPSAFLGES